MVICTRAKHPSASLMITPFFLESITKSTKTKPISSLPKFPKMPSSTAAFGALPFDRRSFLPNSQGYDAGARLQLPRNHRLHLPQRSQRITLPSYPFRLSLRHTTKHTFDSCYLVRGILSRFRTVSRSTFYPSLIRKRTAHGPPMTP